MKDLSQALAFANYQSTLKRERQLIRQRFEDKCIYAYNGGLFKITPEFIASVNTTDFKWIVDLNGNPIEITGKLEFYNAIVEYYADALNEYGTAYNDLKSKRNVKSIVGL